MEKDLMMKRLDYLRDAAEHGSVRAQVSYALYGNARAGMESPFSNQDEFTLYKANALRFLQQAANAGDISALTHLAFAYRDGLLIEPDEIQALAHMMAAQRTGVVRLADRLVSQWGATMHPCQVRKARAMANEIFRRCGHERLRIEATLKGESASGIRMHPETVG